MKVFADTNVLVAAFATRGLCADILRTVLAEHELVVSATVLEELGRALDGKLRLPESMIRDIIAFLRGSAIVVAQAAPGPPPVAVRPLVRSPAYRPCGRRLQATARQDRSSCACATARRPLPA